ncbi:diphthine--ammonia ligase [Candidatus Micrarchaeota archaeon]|nr:diphthine--ammonia ligase [Candidatus Micrarchaeota archaeon]
MKVACLFSGGKDSTYSIAWALNQGWEVYTLISILPMENSYMFHHPNVNWCNLQAEAMQLPLIFGKSHGDKTQEIEDLKSLLSSLKIDGIVSGAIASEYQKEQLDRITYELGIKNFAPLWHKKQEKLLEEMIEQGFEFIITAVSAEGLDEKWLGRLIDMQAYNELRKIKGINIVFEGGEAETFVLNSPIFNKKIKINNAVKNFKGSSGSYLIKEAELA